MIVYKVTNKINGKIYVGITIGTLERRIREHLQFHKRPSPFQCALRNYGIQSFSTEIIDSANDRSALGEKEKYWIKQFNCKSPNGYNLTDGGDGTVGISREIIERIRLKKIGVKASNETRTKMRASSKHIKPSPQAIENMRQRMLGRRHSEEARRKIGDAQRGAIRGPRSEETKARISASNKGKTIPLGVREKISVSLRGKPSWNKGKSWTEEQRKRLSLAHLGKKPSDRTKLKMTIAQKRRWAIHKFNETQSELPLQ